jgi:uncharacterized protein (DUF433 family)
MTVTGIGRQYAQACPCPQGEEVGTFGLGECGSSRALSKRLPVVRGPGTMFIMRKAKAPNRQRIELGRYLVADPSICHGKLTFKGTRVFVADVLADVERGLSWDFIVHRWGGGKISRAAIAEAVRLARAAFLDEQGRPTSLPEAA